MEDLISDETIVTAAIYGNFDVVNKFFNKYKHHLDIDYILKEYVSHLTHDSETSICVNLDIIKYFFDKIVEPTDYIKSSYFIENVMKTAIMK